MDSEAMLLAAGPLARPSLLKSKFMNGKVVPKGFWEVPPIVVVKRD
jgi:hypothetical protein